jgi:hypothetical protein
MISCASIGIILILITPTESYAVQTDRIQTIASSTNGSNTIFYYHGLHRVVIPYTYTETISAIQTCQRIGN